MDVTQDTGRDRQRWKSLVMAFCAHRTKMIKLVSSMWQHSRKEAYLINILQEK